MTSTLILRGAGVLSAVCILVAMALLGEILGAFGDRDEVFIDYYDDSGNRPAGLIGGVALLKGALLFLLFMELLLYRSGEEAQPRLSSYVRALAIVFTALVITAAAALATIDFSRLFALDIFDESGTPFEGSTVAVLPQFGYVLLLVGGGWTAAIIVALASWLGRSNGLLPAPVAYVGFAIAVLLLLSPMVMPFVLFPLWVLLVTLTARLTSTQPAV